MFVSSSFDIEVSLWALGHIGQSYTGSRERNAGRGGAGSDTMVTSYSFDGRRVLADEEEGGRDALVRQTGGAYCPTSFKDSRWCHDTPGVINPEQVSSGLLCNWN